jgi:hypothetical protein
VGKAIFSYTHSFPVWEKKPARRGCRAGYGLSSTICTATADVDGGKARRRNFQVISSRALFHIGLLFNK